MACNSSLEPTLHQDDRIGLLPGRTPPRPPVPPQLFILFPCYHFMRLSSFISDAIPSVHPRLPPSLSPSQLTFNHGKNLPASSFLLHRKKKQNLCVIFIKNNEAYHNPPCPSPQTHFLLGCTRPSHFTPPRLHPHFQKRLQQSDTSPIVGGTECRNINMGIYEDKKIIFISVCVL